MRDWPWPLALRHSPHPENFSCCFLNCAFNFKGFITHKVANNFLNLAFNFFYTAFNLIFIHGNSFSNV